MAVLTAYDASMSEQGPTRAPDADQRGDAFKEPSRDASRELGKPLVDRARVDAAVRGILQNLPATSDPKQVLVSRFLESVHHVMPEQAGLLAEALRQRIAEVPAEDSDALAQCLSSVMNDVAATFITREEFEKRQRAQFLTHGDFIPLSEALAFGVHRDIAHIHLAPANTMGIAGLRADVQTGLRELARRLQEDDALNGVQTVQATLWIVAKNPRLLERLGFTVDGPISQEEREAHFAEDPRDVASAHISREDFIARYGTGV